MKNTLNALALAVLCLAAASSQAQEPTTTAYFQSLACIKVAPDKDDEFRRLVSEITMKTAQVRANAGEILTWTLLRSVFPSGEEAKANYIISTISEGAPRPPVSRSQMESVLKKAGLSMSAEEYYAKRGRLSTLVSHELWRPTSRVAAPAVGHYIFINRMKVLDRANYAMFEQTVWRPMAEEWVKQGKMSGWIFAVKMLPAGTDTPYAAYSADMFPSWEAVFAARPSQPIFEKVHPGKDYRESMDQIPKLRSIGQRELWVVVERVVKEGTTRATLQTTQE